MTKPTIDLSTYSFCEPVWVTGPAPWCIRKLTSTGRRLGGAIDSSSLCGRVKCPADGSNGWDLSDKCVVSLDHSHACKKCVARLRELLADELLSPNTPIEHADAVIRGAGGDPAEVGKRGAAFITELVKKRRDRKGGK